jgi:hypothetical protein
MSVYIFGEGRSIYGDNTNTTILRSGGEYISTTSSSKSPIPRLSTMVLREGTKSSEIVEYATTLRSELEQIRQIFFNNPKPQYMKDYNKFLKIQQQLMSHTDELTQLYRGYETASQLTANRKTALREKIANVGMKISALVRSYNTSGIFVSNENFVTIPTADSYEEVMRTKLLQSLET